MTPAENRLPEDIMRGPGVRAVIFDMDGVLLDSYDAHFESWQRIADECSIKIDEDTFARTFGRTSRDVIREVWKQSGKHDDPSDAQIEDIDHRKEEAYRQIIRENFPQMAGAAHLIDDLRSMGFSLAVGTSGPKENVEFVLDRLGRRDAFQAIVHGKDVTKGKPNPEVFLKAAEKLGVPPHRCAVVEDADLGIKAARSAGMVAIGLISTGRTREELAKAEPHRLVPSLLDINAAEVADLIDAVNQSESRRA